MGGGGRFRSPWVKLASNKNLSDGEATAVRSQNLDLTQVTDEKCWLYFTWSKFTTFFPKNEVL